MKNPLSCRVAAGILILIAGGPVHADTVGHWRFEDTPGFTADSSPSGLTLTGEGSPIPSQVPNSTAAPAFPATISESGSTNAESAGFGTNQGYFSANGANPALDFAEFTIEAFVRPSQIESANINYIAQHWFGAGSTRKWAFAMGGTTQGTTAGELILLLSEDGSSLSQLVQSNLPALVSGRHYYVAASFSQGTAALGDSSVTFYLQDLGSTPATSDDGPLQPATAAATVNDLPIGNQPFYIGTNDATATRAWDGVMDDVRLSNTVLSQSELMIAPGSVPIVTRNGAVVPDEGSDAVGSVTTGVPVALTYTISNPGGTTINLTAAGVAATVNCTASVTSQPADNALAPGESTTMVVSVTAVTAAPWSCGVSFGNDGPDHPTYNWTASGTATDPEPEIAISRGTSPIVNSGDDYIPGTAPGVLKSFNYLIENLGDLNLTFVNALISNPVNCSASITGHPVGPVAPGNSTSLGIAVTPAAAGPWSFVVSLGNNDSNENPFQWTVRAAGNIVIDAHPLVPGDTASTHYTLTVNGVPVPVADWFNGYALAHFSLATDSPVTLEVTASQTITSHLLNPVRDNLGPTVSGNRISWQIDGRSYLRLKVNNLDHLLIFADPFEIDPPTLADPNVSNVLDHSVDNTGTAPATTTSARINAAINAVAADPAKDTLYFPAGHYVCATIYMKSGVNIYLAEGALVQASANLYDMDHGLNLTEVANPEPNAPGFFPGGPYRRRSFFTAYKANDIKIFGRGVIDGRGDVLRLQGQAAPVNISTRPGQVNIERVNNVQFSKCDNIEVDGIISRRSSSWNTTPHYCTDISFRNYKVISEMASWINEDGIDPDSNVRLLVEDSFFLAKDDGIVFKTCGTYPPNGQIVSPDGSSRDTRDVVCRNNVVWTTVANALKFGNNETEASQHHRVTFDGNVVIGTELAGVKVESGGPARFIDNTYRNNWFEYTGKPNIKLESSGTTGLRFINETHLDNGGSTIKYGNHYFSGLTIGGTPVTSANSATFFSITGGATAAFANPPANDTAPRAYPETVIVFRDEPVLVDVMANDTDLDGDPLQIIDLRAARTGTAAIQGGKVLYTPAPGLTGTDDFIYTISDGLESSWTKVTIRIVERTIGNWRATVFDAGDLADSAKEATVWGDHANSDGDDAVVIFEYLFGRDPLASDNELKVLADAGTGAAGIIFWRAKHTPSPTLHAEWTPDLVTPWQTAGLTEAILEENASRQKVRLTLTGGSHEKAFFRFVAARTE